MSCISQILKIKGNKDVLLPLGKDGKPWVAVEGGGTYKDYEYLIVLNHLGHRCGYVAIPPGHPANDVGYEKNTYNENIELNYSKLNIDCHGGLTFGGQHHGFKNLLEKSCADNWIGFDCGHYYDGVDFTNLINYFGEGKKSHLDILTREEDEFDAKTYEYVEKECKHIIDQLVTYE